MLRTLSFSKILLLLFVLGSGSGVVVSTLGWWSIEQSARQIDWLRNANLSNLQHASSMTLHLARMQLHADRVQSGMLRPAEGADGLAREDAVIRTHLDYLKRNLRRDYNQQRIREFAEHYAQLADSQRRVVAWMATDAGEARHLFRERTQPLYEQAIDSAAAFSPGIMKSAGQAYQRAIATLGESEQALLTVAGLSGLFRAYPVVTPTH